MIEAGYRAAKTGKDKLLALLSVCLAALVLPLSFSAGAVATPAIGRDLGGDATSLTWITNAFMLTFGACMMGAGALADQIGRKRMFLSGIASFVVTSVLLSLSPDVMILNILRGLQGIAAAAALASGTAALAQEFEGTARTRAFSLLGTTFGLGLAFGPLVAGAILEVFGWRAVFLSAAFIGVLAVALGRAHIRESRDPEAGTFDWAGAGAFTAALSLFTFGVIQGPALGWTEPIVIILFAGAFAMLIAFIVIEQRSARPMLDLSLFQSIQFVGVQCLPIATCFCYVVLLVALPLRFIGIEGHGELEAGVMMLALSVPMLFVPFCAANLTRFYSPGLISGVGLLLAAAGLCWLSKITPGSDAVSYAGPMLVIGMGTGLPWGLMDGLAVSVVPKERAGMAAGIFSTMRVAGEGMALAVMTAVLSMLILMQLRDFLPQSNTFELSAAALRLATGDLAAAEALAGSDGHQDLMHRYGQAFSDLLVALAGITALMACVILALLRNPPAPVAGPAAETEGPA